MVRKSKADKAGRHRPEKGHTLGKLPLHCEPNTLVNSPKTAIVLGGLGISGQNLIQHLETTGEWRIKTVSRRPPTFETQAQFLSVDLLDPIALEAQAELLSRRLLGRHRFGRR